MYRCHMKLYQFITQTVKPIHKIQTAFLIKPITDMIEHIVIKPLNEIVRVVFHLQIDNNICILLKIDCLHL